MKAPTYIGVISLAFVVLILFAKFLIHLNVYDLSKGCDKDLNIIRPFVTLFFVYTSQNAVFPIIEAVKERTKKK